MCFTLNRPLHDSRPFSNLSGTVAGETRQAIENLRAVLLKAGLDFSDVVQIRIYQTDLAEFDTVNTVYGE